MTLLSFQNIFMAAILSLAVAPLTQILARRFGLVDIPNREPHKQHQLAVPIAGGLVLVFTVIVLSLFQGLWASQTVRALLVSSLLLFLFGFWDDVKGLTPVVKLIGQILGALLLIALGVQVRMLPQNWINIALTLLWVVGITNAYNFVDSMDGLAIGLGAQAAAFFMLVTFDSGQTDLSQLSAILLGACIGCFFFNSSPARFFMGDSGSQFLGFLLAALAIAYNPPGFEQLASWYVPILLMGVPIFDITLVVYSRMRHHQPIYKASRDHSYHRLVSMGMSSNRAVLTMHITAVLLGCLAFVALGLPPLTANLVFATVFATGAVALVLLERRTQLR
jgi:UDP-GlcNAc:undecaprenyl-phosphate/decaprenyl-phosphate GlcNAc-1-phosphate transferase